MRYLIFFLLFLLPFIVLPFGISPYESPKVIVAEGTIGVLFVLATVQNSHKQFFSNRLQIMLVVILFLLSLFHVVFQQSESTFFGNAFRMQGVFLLWLLLGFSLISSRVLIPSFPRIFFLALLIIQGTLSLLMAGNTDRAIGTMGEPNALAASVIFLWPWTLIGIKNYELRVMNKKRIIIFSRFIPWLAFLLSLLIILMSGSRSGMVAFGIQVIFLLLLFFKVRLQKAAYICLLFVIGSLLLPFFQTNTPYENRVEVWKTALIGGYEHHILGWGFGNTEVAMKKYGLGLYTGSHDYYVDSAHNILLDWWVQGGYVGLSLLVLLLYASFRMFEKRKNSLLLMLYFGVVTVMLFNPVSIVTLIQFWWLIGQGLNNQTV